MAPLIEPGGWIAPLVATCIVYFSNIFWDNPFFMVPVLHAMIFSSLFVTVSIHIKLTQYFVEKGAYSYSRGVALDANKRMIIHLFSDFF